jgi:hypothetical protein
LIKTATIRADNPIDDCANDIRCRSRVVSARNSESSGMTDCEGTAAASSSIERTGEPDT